MSSPILRKLVLAVLFAAAGCVVSASAEGPVAAGTVKLAVVDMDRVMSESMLGKAEQTGIDRMRSNRTAVISQNQKELDDYLRRREEAANASDAIDVTTEVVKRMDALTQVPGASKPAGGGMR